MSKIMVKKMKKERRFFVRNMMSSSLLSLTRLRMILSMERVVTVILITVAHLNLLMSLLSVRSVANLKSQKTYKNNSRIKMGSSLASLTKLLL